MTIQSVFRMFIIILVFCLPLGVLGMKNQAGRDAWLSHIDTDSDDDADESTSSDDENLNAETRSGLQKTVHTSVDGNVVKRVETVYRPAQSDVVYNVRLNNVTIAGSNNGTQQQKTNSPVRLRDEYDDEYDKAFSEGFKHLSGKGRINVTPASSTSRRLQENPHGTRSVQMHVNRPREQPAHARPANHQRGQQQEYHYSVELGVPLQVMIPVIVAVLVVGFLIKHWADEQVIIKDDVETKQGIRPGNGSNKL